AIQFVGLGPVFLLNTLLYLGPMMGLLRMRTSELFRTPRATNNARIRDGVRYVLRREDLLVPMVLLTVIGLVGFNFQLTLALLSKTVFKTQAAEFGLLSTMLAVGALLGALISGGRRTRPSVWLVLGAGIVFGALEAVVGVAPTFLVAALVLMPTGFGMIFF